MFYDKRLRESKEELKAFKDNDHMDVEQAKKIIRQLEFERMELMEIIERQKKVLVEVEKSKFTILKVIARRRDGINEVLSIVGTYPTSEGIIVEVAG